MNEYKYNEISVGLKESFSIETTVEMLSGFCRMTGDINPLHGDESYAKSRGYPGKVAFGMLTASLLSTLAGVYLPGKYSLIQQVDFKLPNPVFVGDVLVIEGEVIEKNDLFNVITVKVSINNQHDKKVLRGSMRVGVTE